ncbi:MAG TPA: hypothetical protein VNB49_03295, partial [Candidatus Dormibacteraeota bacterium]|nr:hypothetical protein [Candidatus Dormibacteraeota bacterium]
MLFSDQRLAAGILVVSLAAPLAGCANSGAQNAMTIEPKADISPGPGCTAQTGIAKVNAFFAAINRGDVDLAASMFLDPTAAPVIQPELEITEFEATAHNPEEIRVVLRKLIGMHFVFNGEPQATAGDVQYNISGKNYLMRTV